MWGFVFKDSSAHAIYYAGLMTGHAESSVRLTLSINGWGKQQETGKIPDERSWLFIETRPTNHSYEMMVREPEESRYFGTTVLGKPTSRTEALASPQLHEIFEVADFIACNDPAVRSYLSGQKVSSRGRNTVS